jgi:hypothetical protein
MPSIASGLAEGLGYAEIGRSPASVSQAVGYLEGLEVIRRERDPRRRRERYLIDEDVWLRTWMTSARKHVMRANAAERRPDITDPVALERTESGACTVTARLDRLTTTQREALSHPHRRCQPLTTGPHSQATDNDSTLP